jgi:hypothetical protein
MQRDHDRHAQLSDEVDDVISGIPTEDAELVFNQHHIGAACHHRSGRRSVVTRQVLADDRRYFSAIETMSTALAA